MEIDKNKKENNLKKILIVDDMGYMRKILEKLFTANDYEVVGTASDGAEALSMYETMKPDIVIMDLCMPEKMGDNKKIIPSKTIKKGGMAAIIDIMSINPGAKILVCSARNDKELVMEALKAGVKGYIVKPFEHKKLLTTVERIVNIP